MALSRRGFVSLALGALGCGFDVNGDEMARTLQPTRGRFARRIDPELLGTITPEVLWVPDDVPEAKRWEFWHNLYTGNPASVITGLWQAFALTAASGEQATVTDPDAAFGGYPSYDLDGSNDSYTHGSTSSHKILHTGPVLVFGISKPETASANLMVLATMTISENNTGIAARADTVAGTLQVALGNGTGTYVFDVRSYPTSISQSLFCYVWWIWPGQADDDDEIDEYRLFVGHTFDELEIVASGTLLGDVATGNHHSALRIGRNGGAANNFFNGDWGGTGIVTDPQLEQRFTTWLAQTYL